MTYDIRQMIASRRGQLSLEVLFFAAIVVVLITGFVFWALSFLQLSVRSFNRSLAFSIAESGIEYYRWHLAHDSDDFWDGQGSTSTGPYTHNYYGKNGDIIGQFILDITPPPIGSTVVTIESTGKVVADNSVEKIIEVRMGIPSFAKYAVAANDTMRFGEGTEVFGEIISNGRIRFDGFAHNIVKSALPTSTDTDYDACTSNVWGVHTCVDPDDPAPPTPAPSRPDVFAAGREFPVPAVNFDGLTQDLSSLKTLAQTDGLYAPSSSASGYDLVLKTDGTFVLYKVNSLVSPPGGCNDYLGQSGWGTWSVQSESVYASGTLPSNGIFFVEDNLWVRGQIDDARLTIVSGRFPDNPSTRTSITVNSDILYTNYDGTDVIALIAQNNINIGMVSADDFRIDAALVAQNGRVGRYYYRPPWWFFNGCYPYHERYRVVSYGMIGTNQRYGFAYTDGTGYEVRDLIYDANLLYGPPPSFPLTSDNYVQMSWEEIK